MDDHVNVGAVTLIEDINEQGHDYGTGSNHEYRFNIFIVVSSIIGVRSRTGLNVLRPTHEHSPRFSHPKY